MEFVFNVGDWPIEKNLDNPLPVFSWCGSGKTADIIFPTWDQTKNTRLALARKGYTLTLHLCKLFYAFIRDSQEINPIIKTGALGKR